MNAIEAEKLSCAIGGAEILSDVSFSLDASHWLSVIGPNGAGKTTLLRCLMGMLPCDGAVRIFGNDARFYSRKALAKRLSYVPQLGTSYVPFTVYDFVLMGRYPYLSPFSNVSAEDKEMAWHALESTDMTAFADRAMESLSGGERQRAFIAAALAQGHEILLLDEPAAFLDYKHQVATHALLRRLCREMGVTIVSVTHDAARATFESDRVLALKQGQVVYAGPPDGLHDGAVLEKVYETPFRIVQDIVDAPPLVIPVEAGE